MNTSRVACAVLGLAGTAYGLVRLLDLGPENLRASATWLVGGVFLHDGVLAPLTIIAGLVLASVWRRAGRGAVPGPVLAGGIVLGAVTVVAVPVLGRFGARADNSTLLDRNYVLGWLVLATLTMAISGVAVAVTAVRGRRKGGADGTRARGR